MKKYIMIIKKLLMNHKIRQIIIDKFAVIQSIKKKEKVGYI